MYVIRNYASVLIILKKVINIKIEKIKVYMLYKNLNFLENN